MLGAYFVICVICLPSQLFFKAPCNYLLNLFSRRSVSLKQALIFLMGTIGKLFMSIYWSFISRLFSVECFNKIKLSAVSVFVFWPLEDIKDDSEDVARSLLPFFTSIVCSAFNADSVGRKLHSSETLSGGIRTKANSACLWSYCQQSAHQLGCLLPFL